jgi:chemotaxis protein MotB
MGTQMHRPPYHEEKSISGQGWLTTFNDMATLLMVFFVLLFTMGSLDVKRFKNFQDALQSAMGVLHEGRHAPEGTLSRRSSALAPETAGHAEGSAGKEAEGLESLVETQGLEAEYTDRGIRLTLDDKLLFGSGSAVLTDEGKQLLIRVAAVIRDFDRTVRIEGHTDNVPISTVNYPSNWELSIARAITVVKYLIQSGGMPPERFAAAGYGDSRPRVANNSPANRASNRRVEIILGPAPSGVAPDRPER